MSFDHKPEDEPEKNRINKAGGKVTMDGRVNGGLNLSRAIGELAQHFYPNLPTLATKFHHVLLLFPQQQATTRTRRTSLSP